jgi:hypothetical protein
MASYPRIQRPLPLITARMEFRLAPRPPLPKITMRMEFSRDRFRQETTEVESESSPDERGQRREEGRQSVSPDDQDDGNQGNSDSDHDASPQTETTRAFRITLSRPSATNKIPKPPGEPGRPGSGGYCIHTVLTKTHNWSGESVDKLTVSTARREAPPLA